MDPNGKFYFIEANARIQVEHPITEMVSGLDLIREQIHVAFGDPLSIKQEEIRIEGHAIECRVNAEDPETFSPSTGKIEKLHWPGGPGIRVDSHIRQGDKVTPFYDSLLGKIMAWGTNRDESIQRMLCALDECEVLGIKTNIPLHRQLLRHPDIVQGKLHVGLVEALLLEKVFG